MRRWLKSLVPAVAALSAMFMVLPNGGGDVEVRTLAREGSFVFSPAEITLDPGERAAFINDTSTTHSARCDGCPASTLWDTGDIQPGETVLMPFDADGAYRFFCVYHGQQGMVGTLVVGEAELAPVPIPTLTGLPGG